MNRLKSNRVRGPERLGRPYNVTRLGSAGPTGTKSRSAHTLKKIFRLYIQARNSQEHEEDRGVLQQLLEAGAEGLEDAGPR